MEPARHGDGPDQNLRDHDGDDQREPVEAHPKRGKDGVLASDCSADGMAVRYVALHHLQLLVLRGHFRWVAYEGGDFVTLLQRLLDERASGTAGGSEDEKFHKKQLLRLAVSR